MGGLIDHDIFLSGRVNVRSVTTFCEIVTHNLAKKKIVVVLIFLVVGHVNILSVYNIPNISPCRPCKYSKYL